MLMLSVIGRRIIAGEALEVFQTEQKNVASFINKLFRYVYKVFVLLWSAVEEIGISLILLWFVEMTFCV